MVTVVIQIIVGSSYLITIQQLKYYIIDYDIEQLRNFPFSPQ